MKRLLHGLVIAVLLSGPGRLLAACSVSASSVAFGNYNTFDSSPVDGAGTITVTCGVLDIYSVALSTGSGSYSARTLVNGGNTLEYNLYTNASRSSVWGDGTGGTSIVEGAIGALGLPVNHTVYGRIPANQNPLVGSYVDTITVTVTF